MTNCKIKIITGFRRDQEHTVEGDEAHKAYYLFLHPAERGIFRNGLAIKGDQIQEIVPNWQATMGWNEAHNLDAHDWNEIHRSGASRKMNALMTAAREIATVADLKDMSVPLTELVEKKYPRLLPAATERREGTMKSIAEIAGGKKVTPKKRPR